MIKGINAILIETHDVRRLATFYKEVVGLNLAISDHGGGMHAEGDVGGIHFAIFPGGTETSGRRPLTFSLHVDNIDREYDRLKANGVAFAGPPARKGFGGVLASFQDPDGNGVCLMVWESEWKQAEDKAGDGPR